MDEVRFSRRPYNVTYYKDGEQHTIRRVPPRKLHDIMPKDEVMLTTKKNVDFEEGDEFTVKNISPRQPNTIQVEDDEGRTTFVPYYDLEVTESFDFLDDDGKPVAANEAPVNNRYLLWP